ncbi:unnamed protein product [Dovyalis caffra]|uniref:Transmembrane protein n=1 Tax=Dovyalis caffra TaxID=77055 RepID=A0AAV1S913_9ROSI|nr:unnamed protein product [Dovyalis caffra]
MLLLSQAPGGALSAKRCTPLKFAHQNQPLFLNSPKPKFISRKRPPFPLTLAKAEGGLDSTSATKQPLSTNNPTPSPSTPAPSFNSNDTVFVGQEDVPLEGVIQFEKPTSSGRLEKWGRVALLAGGDVLALLFFSAIGRFSHGFSVFDFQTLRSADPFIAGWFLCAYFLGGYGEDGRGMNGLSKTVIAAAKSWAVGVPLGMIIRAASSGHVPPYAFILVTMGSTGVLLIGWRVLLSSVLSNNQTKKNDVYRRGSPFELFEDFFPYLLQELNASSISYLITGSLELWLLSRALCRKNMKFSLCNSHCNRNLLGRPSRSPPFSAILLAEYYWKEKECEVSNL